jgi:hypothetical protein
MRHLALGLLALAVTTSLLASTDAPAQEAGAEQTPIQISADGTQIFRGLLDLAGVKPITQQELFNFNRPDDIIVISLGTTIPQGIRRYDPKEYVKLALARGGAAMIATDTSLQFNFSDGGAFSVTGERITCPDEIATLPGRDYCPFVVPIIPERGTQVGKLFENLDRVATNSSSYISLHLIGGNFENRLATFPMNSINVNTRRSLLRNSSFAIGGEMRLNNVQSSRFLALADHSIFINQMLLEPGTDNLELTKRTIEFLKGPNQRTRCLFFEDGQVVDRFDELRHLYAKQQQQGMPMPQVNLWALQDKLTDLGNSIIDQLQTNNAHNSLILGSGQDPERQHRVLSGIMRFMLVLLTIYGLWFVLRRVWASRKPTDVLPPPAVATAPSGPPGVFERRQKELLRRNNIFEPVRDLVREFFISIGVEGEPGVKPPALAISDVVRKKDSLRKAIRDFWRLAYGPAQVVTIKRWNELEPFFERVRQAHADGKWHFVFED